MTWRSCVFYKRSNAVLPTHDESLGIRELQNRVITVWIVLSDEAAQGTTSRTGLSSDSTLMAWWLQAIYESGC